MKLDSLQRRHSGFSMLSAMLGVLISGIVTATATSLLAKAIQGDGLDRIDNATADLRKHIQLWQETSLGAGANLDAQAGLDTIQVCSFTQDSSGNRSCRSSYSPTGDACFVYTSQNVRGQAPALFIRAFRLIDGQLQFYTESSNTLTWNRHRSVCEGNVQWTALNDVNTYRVSSLRVCNVNTANPNFHNANFSNSCQSVLSTNPIRNRAWLLVINTAQTNNPAIQKEMLGWLWHQNLTRVSNIN